MVLLFLLLRIYTSTVFWAAMNKKDKKALTSDESDIIAEGSTQSQAVRNLRGRTHMHCLSMQRAQGIKQDVELNELGQPIGPAATQMQSYIGVLARERVKITYNTWKEVPNDVKELIWDSVNMSFNIDKGWKPECLKSANQKWRQFKTKLTNEFVYARVDSPDLRHPPLNYPFIEENDWTNFLLTRLTDNFKRVREQQKDRRSQNIYPHRLSRKGYAKFAQENPKLMSDDREINQAKLWVEGRKSKDGQHEGDDLKEKVAKIVNYSMN